MWALLRVVEDAEDVCEHGSYPMYDPNRIYLY